MTIRIFRGNPISEITKKLDYYRNLLGKTHDLVENDFLKIASNISTFFNITPLSTAHELPEWLVRVSNNNRF